MQKMADKLLVQFEKFCTDNPLEFDEAELAKIERDIVMPRKGVVCDEFVDFKLWSQGKMTRQEKFGELVEGMLPVRDFPQILEVGCGKKARLARYLADKGYEMTAMDPQLDFYEGLSEKIMCVRGEFDWETCDIADYDAVIGQEPCEATEHIVRACVKYRKNFVIFLCGVQHKLLNGEMPQDAEMWYTYLQKIGGKNCEMLRTELIEGYMSHILLGKF